MKSLILIVTLLASCPLSGQELTMHLENSEVNGNMLTYDVRVENFTDMLSMQYGIVYDADALTFIEFQNLDLLGLGPQNFNAAEPGAIRMLWYDLAVQGVTLEDSALIYQIIFELQGSDPGDVCYSEDPLIIEFVNLELELPSFMVKDDCHTEPFSVSLITSSTREAEDLGINISTIAQDNHLHFTMSRSSLIQFQIFDISGRAIQAFPESEYVEGDNALEFESPLPSGIYILHAVLDGNPVSLKFVY